MAAESVLPEEQEGQQESGAEGKNGLVVLEVVDCLFENDWWWASLAADRGVPSDEKGVIFSENICRSGRTEAEFGQLGLPPVPSSVGKRCMSFD